MRTLSKPKLAFTSWLAVGLVLWGALATSFAHSVASWGGQDAHLLVVCGSQQDQPMVGDGDREPSGKGGETGQLGHCAYCLLCSPNWLPTAEFAAVAAKDLVVYAAPNTDPSISPIRRPWASPHTRAPPIV